MKSFSDPYLNLFQTSVWILFRRKNVVADFANLASTEWSGFVAYPSMWPLEEDDERYDIVKGCLDPEDTERQEQRSNLYKQMQNEASAALNDLNAALNDGRLTAYGRSASTSGEVQTIDAIEWTTLNLNPPRAHILKDAQYVEPWLDIRLRSKDVMAIWPASGGTTELKRKRSAKDWDAVDRCINRLRASNEAVLSSSGHSLAERIKRMLDNDGLSPSQIPGNRSLRDHISKLRGSGRIPQRQSR